VASPDSFRHEAYFYADHAEFVAGVTSFAHDALVQGEPVLVVVDPATIDMVRGALNGASDHIQFADMTDVGRNPARIIPVWQEFVDRYAATSRRLRGISQPVWVGRSPPELAECRQHEALLNLAFADTPGFWLLCPYDISSLDQSVINQAVGTHPFVIGRRAGPRNPRYQNGADAGLLEDPLPEPDRAPIECLFGPDLAGVRRFVARYAEEVGLSGSVAADLILVAAELTTNSLRHGGGAGLLRLWVDDGAVVCEVQDRGRLTDPLVGRRKPTGRHDESRGLWVVNQICDLVQLRSSKQGTTVRAQVRSAEALRRQPSP
jgi:anti-sigma regulatory factor (Ser/Thr protein kinase)